MRVLSSIRTARKRSAFVGTIVCACGVAFLLSFTRLGLPLGRVSFDTPFLFRDEVIPQEAVIVTMDETTFEDRKLNAGYEYPKFNRATHGQILNQLKSNGVPLVVFDIFFKAGQDEDPEFVNGITNHGNVIIAAELEDLRPMFAGYRTNDPAPAFMGLQGCQIAFPEAPNHAGVVRMFPEELEYYPSIPVAAASAMGVEVNGNPESPRWVRYYGDRGTLPTIAYQHVSLQQPAFFSNRVVFIGGKPKIQDVGEKPDEFLTPLSRWYGNKMRGVEIHATMFLNLIRNEWLTPISTKHETLLILFVGIVFGWIFTGLRPLPALVLMFAGSLGIAAGAIALFWTQHLWFNWALVAGIEIPVAWAASAIIYARTVDREKESLLHERESLLEELESIKSAKSAAATLIAVPRPVSPASALADLHPVTAKDAPVKIRDFDLITEIGSGAYGEVWLARNLVGAYRAIKIVFRKNFPEQRPFEREFEGVRNFEAISRAHPGWVSILHIGKDETGGFFYYVMDPADDLNDGPAIDPGRYVPKTLGKLLTEKEHLSITECVDIGIDLADALAALHSYKLVHRDVKPSNIIFANNRPRLVDIGLVAHLEDHKSIVGTHGFMPPEHPGTPLADIFSLGRVLYMAATGCPPDRHPELPTSLADRSDSRELMQLMEIINKACERSHANRYQSAALLRDDLAKLKTRFAEVRS